MSLGVVLVIGLAIFIIAFMRTEFALWLVLFSMLLSPEFAASGATLAEKRQVMVRSEDLLLILIGVTWLAKTAMNKELGLVGKTPVNRPIAAYIVVHLVATLVGYLTGTVRTTAGFFYVLKYVEYFVVFFMVVNNLRDRDQAWRLVTIAFVTAAIVSLIGISQIPSGQRVSAPFEGEAGEPNTFGGYLVFMIALALGVALETPLLRLRVACFGLAAIMIPPFLFTLSRASYLALVPMLVALGVQTSRRRIVVNVAVLGLALLPFVPFVVPTAVTKRVTETFVPHTSSNQPRVLIGQVGFDTSTSERLLSYRSALDLWLRRPILGHGVTGGFFLDAQYPRTLMETGVIGLGVLLWLLWSVLQTGRSSLARVTEPNDRGLVIGFVAGFVGLCAHAIGSNTFIIIRVMEPFWFFAGIIVMLPMLQPAAAAAPAAVRPAMLRPAGVTNVRLLGSRRAPPAPPWRPRSR